MGYLRSLMMGRRTAKILLRSLRACAGVPALVLVLGVATSCQKKPASEDAAPPAGSPEAMTPGQPGAPGSALFDPNTNSRPAASTRGPSREEQQKAQAKQRAIDRYPELAVAGSPLNKLFVLRLKRFETSNPAFFENPEWPSELARQCAAELPPPLEIRQ